MRMGEVLRNSTTKDIRLASRIGGGKKGSEATGAPVLVHKEVTMMTVGYTLVMNYLNPWVYMESNQRYNHLNKQCSTPELLGGIAECHCVFVSPDDRVSAESLVARKGRMDVFSALGFLDLGKYSAQACWCGSVY
jgi:hypothetical protein